METKIDTIYGGLHQEIKFPMPNTIDFLMRYSYQFDDVELEKYVEKSLTKLAFGGIYDQVNGGFSRYSKIKNGIFLTLKKCFMIMRN